MQQKCHRRYCKNFRSH